MSKFAYGTMGKTFYVNGSLVSLPGSKNLVLVNGTLIQLRLHEPYEDSQLNELLYVIIVIVFYATALMTLIITQIKRQRREGTEVDYYDEYLQRNSEVKRTCQAATTIVSKPPTNTQSQRVTAALASACVAAASAGSIMGITADEATASSALLTEERETTDNINNNPAAPPPPPPPPPPSTGRFGEHHHHRGRGGGSGGGGGGKVLGGGGGGFPSTSSCSGTSNSGGGTLTPLFTGRPSSVGSLPSFGNTRTILARERSPTRVLESIPDEGVEE